MCTRLRRNPETLKVLDAEALHVSNETALLRMAHGFRVGGGLNQPQHNFVLEQLKLAALPHRLLRRLWRCTVSHNKVQELLHHLKHVQHGLLGVNPRGRPHETRGFHVVRQHEGGFLLLY